MESSEHNKPVMSRKGSTKPHRHVLFHKILLALVVLAVGFSGGWLGARSYLQNPNTFSQQTDQARRTVTSQSELISAISTDVGPSVVSVNVTSQGRSSQSFFDGAQVFEEESAGTGFIISKSGYIVTNRHVVPDGISKVSVVLSDGKVYEDVTVVGKTSENDSLDVAFLKIENPGAKELKPVVLGDSSKMRVGDMSIAIGNALGQFQNTVTSGIISGYGRSVQAQSGSGSVESLNNLFQTDAAINQGNSGGPLVNSDGHVIGINTAVAGDGAENIGFAIPINDVLGLINGVLEKGKLLRPYIGVRYIQLNEEIASELDINTTEGAYIPEQDQSGPSIIKGSPAEKAGLSEKDIIVKINDQKIDSNNTLSSVIGRFSVGEEVNVTFVRDGKEQTTKITLDELDQN